MNDKLSNYENNYQKSPEQGAEIREQNEPLPSMDDYIELIDKSFRKISEGDIVKGVVIGKSDTEVAVDLGYYTEGIIKLEELSNDPTFSIKEDIEVGEEISALVMSEDDGNGNILLSKKRADDILAWDKISEDFESRNIVRVKITQAVKGGVVAYLHGIRAFIPASQLSLNFVEDLDAWVGREIEAVVVTASKEKESWFYQAKMLKSKKPIRKKPTRYQNCPVAQ
jgi:S1 RNA binding domain.